MAVVHVPERALRPDDAVLLQEEVFPVCSPELHPFASKAVCRCHLLQKVHENAPEMIGAAEPDGGSRLSAGQAYISTISYCS